MPGASLTVQTYNTHVWRVEDEAEQVLTNIVATTELSQLYQVHADKRVARIEPLPCRLPVAGHEALVGLGFPKSGNFRPSTGVVKAVLLFADFSDAPASQTPEQTFARVSPGAEKFYADISYGRIGLRAGAALHVAALEAPFHFLCGSHQDLEPGLPGGAGEAPEYLAFERWMLGWLDDDPIGCQSQAEAMTVLSAEGQHESCDRNEWAIEIIRSGPGC